MEDRSEETVDDKNGEGEEEDYYFGESPDFESPSSEALPPIPSPDEISAEKEEQKPKRRFCSFWKRPPTKVYSDNFGFSVNSYQPMIEYLDIKDSGGNVRRGEVHLPSLEERCLRQYSSKKPFKWYNNSDIDRYIAKGEKIRTQIRQNDAAGASNVLRRTHTNWSMTRKAVQLVKNSYVIDHRKSLGDSVPEKPVKSSVLPRYPRPTSLKKYLLVPLSDFESLNMDIAKTHQIDHELTMAARRKRMQDIDNQFGSAVDNMSATINLMNRPKGEPVDIPIDTAEDLIMANRCKREEEMDHIIAGVENLTNAGSERNVMRRFYNNELDRIPTERHFRPSNVPRVVYLEDPTDRMVDHIRMQQAASPLIDSLDVPRYRRPREDTLSDVQDRVMNRAREMTGTTSEMRRINNRSKYLNVMGPRTTSDLVPVGYTKVADNINHMARSLAGRGARGKALRQYDVDDEVADDLILSAGIGMQRKAPEIDLDKPLRMMRRSPEPSNSIRVREAQGRASWRNAMLYGY